MSNLRKTYGETLVALGKENPNIVVLEADLSRSTMGSMFGQAFPDRFFDFGIAEANMCSAAAGMSLVGKIPFMASFAVFSTGRCYDQIRTSVCISKLNVKICGSSAGLSDSGDGPTHQSIDDISLMRCLPNMQVFVPCDSVQTKQVMRYMAENKGPMYIRITRTDALELTDETQEFIPGKIYPVRDGSDSVVFACGSMVACALEAAEILESKGISVKVINVPSIKPLNQGEVLAACAGAKVVVAAEEHNIIGGLGSAIAEIADCKVHRFGVPDRFGASATNHAVLCEELKLTPKDLADMILGSI